MTTSPPLPDRPRPLPFPLALRRVLFPTDLRSESDAAFSHAALLAERFHAELTLFHSIDVREVGRAAGGGAPMAEAMRVAEASALRFLEARAAQTRARTRITVEYGLSPHQAVVAAIAAAGADLTVMSTHGRRGIAHALIGSVAETAIEEGGRPTLCVRARHAAPAGGSYRRILVPTDLRARGAFPIAAFLARGFGAQVVGVHVVPAARASMSGLPQGLASELPGEDDVLRFLAPDFDGIPVSTRVELGSGWGAIPRIAREERCDLVAMHAGRRDGLTGAVLGSHAERIVALAPCPVLVV